MDNLNYRVSVFAVVTAFLLTLHLTQEVRAWDIEYSVAYEGGPEIIPYRHKRDAPVAIPPAIPTPPAPLVPPAVNTTVNAAVPVTANATANATTVTPTPSANASQDINRTTNVTATTLPVPVTQTPLLGVNGSGIFKGNITDKMPAKVSDPILADDNITTVNFEEELAIIEAQTNLTNLKYDNHIFYNSTFIGNQTFFQEHWANITKPKLDVHPILSNSHRRATTLKLSFTFPFYGHPLQNITVATGGFLYTGEHVHNWLAATQYIAPLMANFDTTLTVDSCVKLFDDGEKFTALWENVNIREDKTKQFTFAATLYKNGDIIFAYKDIPIPVQLINENEHPVKVGISDAYQTDRMMFYIRRKTIYEYHRVSYKTHNITNGTILKMVALPTCLQYDTCESCANHETEFNCSWCEQLRKCSSGTDRNKQDWIVRGCDRSMIVNASQCPAPRADSPSRTSYTTDTQTAHETVVHQQTGGTSAVASAVATAGHATAPPSPVGAAVAAITAIALVATLAGWLLYAFKNPHTRSGQLLIKYRPSQWSWRRGEARYTAATIHM